MSTKLTKKTIVALASMMLACFVSIADENPYTVQYTVNGYAGTEALTNFPVLVRLSAGSPVGFAYADCAAGGADLTFTDDGGNVIPREIDTWNTAGESLVWVCVPVVTNGTSFTMHYGNTTVAAQPACQTDGSVWSNANYNAVWHFASSNKESVHGLSATVNGTTDYKNDNTHPTVMGGNALWLSNNGYLRYANSADWTTLGDGNTLTLSCWAISQSPGYGRMISAKQSWNGEKGFELTTQNSDTTITIGSSNDSQAQFTVPSVKSWRHVTATYASNGSLSLWVDGVSKGSQAKSVLTTPTDALTLGANSGTGNYWPGAIDEVRIHRGVESGDWIKACYDTMTSASFLTAGPRRGGAAPVLAGATATPGYTDAQLSIRLSSVGDGATSASVTLAYGPEGGALSAPVVLAAAATDNQTLSTNLTGLVAGTAYHYVFMAENDLPSPLSQTVEGTFTTRALTAPTISLSDQQEGPDSQTVGATVTELGGASSCDLYFAYGPEGSPLAYTQVGTDLAAGATFSRLLEGLDIGTVYAYSFAVTNDLGLGTVETGTFTAGVGFLNPAHFAYRATFTVTGYTGTEVLTNFPVLVRLVADSPLAFDYADCAAGGSDIRFADAEGKLIPHEIETWNTAGESLVWVGLPIATNGASFTMFYHAPDPGVTAAGSVWARYAVVIHGGDSLANAVAGGVAVIAGSDAVSATAGSGVVGGGVNKSTANAKGLNVGNPAKAGVLADNNEFSLSAWFKRTGSGTAILAGSRTSWNSQPGFLWLQEKTDRISVAANNAHQLTTNNQKLLSTDSWTHLAFTVNDTVELKSYFDGAPDQSKESPLTLLNTSNDYWTFGSYCDTATGDSYSGDMDELRIFDGVASGDWIRAEHDTVASTTFLTAGPSSANVNPQLSTSSLLVDRDAVNVSATIDAPGGDAASCDLYFAYALSGNPLPAWTLVASGLSAGDTRTRNLTGLVEDVDYDYAFLASNTLGRTIVKAGTFMTGIGFKRPDTNVAEFSRGVKFTVTGYTGSQELTNFPVLVRLSAGSPTGFSYADFYNPGDVAGADLCFLDAAGNGIPHEIDTWNPNGESLVWVTLPRMVNGTEFSMWYRSSKNGSVVCADNAWEDYTGVWHLGEGGDGVQTVADSTTNELDGVTHANSSAQAEGRVGGSRRVSDRGGASDANGRILVSLGDSASPKRAAVDALAATGSDKTFTASAWLRPRGGTDYAYLFSRKTDDKYGAWGVQFNVNSSGWYNQMRVYSAGTADNQSAALNVDSTGNGVWRKVDVVWTKTTYTVYYDGGAKKWSGSLNSSNGQEPLNGSSDLSFGGNTSSGYGSLNGELDEVRLRRGSMGDDWVKADYDTVNDPAFLNGGEVVVLAETPRPIATFALSDSGAKYAQFSGSIGNCGGEADECTVYAKVWETADEEPAAWTLLVSGLGAGDTFSKAVTGLDPETAYSYKIKAVNNLDTPVDSEIAEGTFTTGGTGAGGTGGERYRVGNDYVHVFEVDPETGANTFEFTPPSYLSSVQALVVAGGGPGGYRRGGGGGAGGLIYDAALAVSGGATYAINVGTGGVASASASAYGSNGGDSSIVGTGVNVIAAGGGAGGNGPSNGAGVAGGSGGGAGSGSTTVGAGTAGQGNAGGIRGVNGNNSTGGGGGGAGRPGSDGSLDSPPSGGSGGQGFLTDISGTPTWYAGGGGGGGVQAGNSGNMGSPGGGGDGGGGTGGMAVPNGATNASFGPAAGAGQNGLGGGGGGGSDVSGFYEGGNGGNGIVIVRYTVQGTGVGSAEPVVSLTGATYAGDLKITGSWRVAWAGEGANDADVYIKWGYAANSLTHSVKVAQDAVGTGTFEITVPVDQKTIYLRAMADNGNAQGLSDEIVPIYIPEYSGVVPGDPTIPVLGTVSLAADGVFARVSGTVTSFGTAGAGEDPITNCVVYALVGTSANVSRMNAQDAMPVTAGEPFSLAISNLTANVTYYWCLEARNSAGVAVATEVGSFTTLERSLANTSTTTSANQRNVSVSGSLSQVGAGTTTILARWNDGGWSAWEPVATFVPGAASTAFTATHLASGWSNVGWEIMCSNECATAEGVPTGQAWTSTLSGTVSPEDKAVYTWQPVDGDWNGAWNDSAHWSCSSEDGRGYPQMGTATASFANCTLANPVTVSVPTAHTIGTLRFFGENPVSLTFVGQGASASRILAATLQEQAAKSDSVLEFRDMTIGRVSGNFWTVAKGDASPTNVILRFSGTTLTNVSSFVFAAPYSSLEFLNGSSATFDSKMSVGGTNTVVTIDNSTVNAKSVYIPADADGPGMKVRLRGTNPLLKQNHVDGDFSSWAQSWPVVYEFQVPVGGYTAAPIQMVSTSYKFGQANTSDKSGATPTFSFAVAADSPALKNPGTISNNVLVQTASGFQIDRMADPLGTVPRNNGTVKYGVDGAETSDTDAARQILLDLTGRSPLTMILVW